MLTIRHIKLQQRFEELSHGLEDTVMYSPDSESWVRRTCDRLNLAQWETVTGIFVVGR